MGLDFIRAKAKRYEQQRDKSKIEELDTANLLTDAKKDAVIRLFLCQLDDLDTVIVPGLVLIGRVESETLVNILQRGRRIGKMLPDDAVELTRLMKLNRAHLGVISLTTQTEASMDGIFAVKPKKRFRRET
ncbi:MAG: hypothetical protein V7609_1039 [Verrucomicrobiota bacterium]